jgi:hypothetical protein
MGFLRLNFGQNQFFFGPFLNFFSWKTGLEDQSEIRVALTELTYHLLGPINPVVDL